MGSVNECGGKSERYPVEDLEVADGCPGKGYEYDVRGFEAEGNDWCVKLQGVWSRSGDSASLTSFVDLKNISLNFLRSILI